MDSFGTSYELTPTILEADVLKNLKAFEKRKAA